MSNSLSLMGSKDHPHLPNHIIKKNQKNSGITSLQCFCNTVKGGRNCCHYLLFIFCCHYLLFFHYHPFPGLHTSIQQGARNPPPNSSPQLALDLTSSVPSCCGHVPIPSQSLSSENFSSGSLSLSPILVLPYVLVISMTPKVILPWTFIFQALDLFWSTDLALSTTSATLSQWTCFILCHYQ